MMLLNHKQLGLLIGATALVITGGILTGCGQTAHSSEVIVTPATPTKDTPTPELKPDVSQTATPDRHSSELKQETRALWSWAGQRAKSKADMDNLVAKLDAARLNVILLMVYRSGAAYFEPSHTRFPNSDERLPNNSAFVADGYPDALSYLLEIRDRRRLDDNPSNDFEVHAWFTVATGGNADNDSWPPLDKTQPYMLNGVFPEFKLKYGSYYLNKDRRFIDGAISVVHQPKFRAYITDLIAGLLEDYHVDGIHLDYMRAGAICFNDEPLDYPGTESDYPGCQADYKAWTRKTYGQEHTLWDDTDGAKAIRDEAKERVGAWQAQAVEMLVKRIHDEVKSVNPEVVISVASVANDVSRTSMRQLINGQSAWEWLDRGWIDAEFVTAYTGDTQEVVDKIQAVRAAIQDESRRSLVFPGLSTYTPDDPEEFWSYLLAEQVEATMRTRWTGQPLEPPARGVAFFLDIRLSETGIKVLADGPFEAPALPFWGNR